jgi:kinesin family protein 2/24
MDIDKPDDLIAFVRFGSGVRTTSATGVHDASSRSHAILRMYVRLRQSSSTTSAEYARKFRGVAGEDTPLASAAEFEGVLSLVDLAGSEKNIDSMHHSAQRRKEGAQINASLMALKECVRARASGKNRECVCFGTSIQIFLFLYCQFLHIFILLFRGLFSLSF